MLAPVWLSFGVWPKIDFIIVTGYNHWRLLYGSGLILEGYTVKVLREFRKSQTVNRST